MTPPPTAHAPTRTSTATLATLATLTSLAACVQTGPGRLEPRAIPRPDTPLTIDTVGFAIDTTPDDTDRNGFFDTYTVTAYLFAQRSGYPLSIFADGDLRFTLTDRNANTIAAWQLDQQELEDARFNQPIGETYRFSISLFDADTPPNTDNPSRPPDRLAPAVAYLNMTYIPSDASSPIRADKSLTVRIGATGL